MKKITLAILIILNLALLNACGNDSADITNPSVSPDTNTVSDGTTPPTDTTATTDTVTPPSDNTAQNDTVKKPGIPGQSAPTDSPKTNVDAEVKSILQDINKEENAPAADTANTPNQPAGDVPPDAGTTAPQQ